MDPPVFTADIPVGQSKRTLSFSRSLQRVSSVSDIVVYNTFTKWLARPLPKRNLSTGSTLNWSFYIIFGPCINHKRILIFCGFSIWQYFGKKDGNCSSFVCFCALWIVFIWIFYHYFPFSVWFYESLLLIKFSLNFKKTWPTKLPYYSNSLHGYSQSHYHVISLADIAKFYLIYFQAYIMLKILHNRNNLKHYFLHYKMLSRMAFFSTLLFWGTF